MNWNPLGVVIALSLSVGLGTAAALPWQSGPLMSLKNALNVLLVAFWIVAQTAMAMPHMAFASSTFADHAASAVADDTNQTSDSLLHDHAFTADQVGAKPKTDYRDARTELCSSAVCFAVGGSDLFGLCEERVSRVFGLKPVYVLLPVNPGLPTPPPNTIV